jgi:hypothetical protein
MMMKRTGAEGWMMILWQSGLLLISASINPLIDGMVVQFMHLLCGNKLSSSSA